MPADIRRGNVAPNGNEGFIVTTMAGGVEYEYHLEIVSRDAPRQVEMNLQYERSDDGVVTDEDQEPTDAVIEAVESKGYEVV